MRRTTWIALLLAAMSLPVADANSVEAHVLIYAEDFNAGPGGWVTNDGRGGSKATRMRWSREGFVRASSPWWIDNNHVEPGAGALHLLSVLHLRGKYGGLPFDNVDLADARLQFRMRQGQPIRANGAKLHFWFQTHDRRTGMLVNYAYTRHDLLQGLDSEVGRWRLFSLRLSTNPKDWTCLGASEDRSDTYGCSASVVDALKSVDTDFGLILLPVDAKKLPTGALDLDDFRLWVRLPQAEDNSR